MRLHQIHYERWPLQLLVDELFVHTHNLWRDARGSQEAINKGERRVAGVHRLFDVLLPTRGVSFSENEARGGLKGKKAEEVGFEPTTRFPPSLAVYWRLFHAQNAALCPQKSLIFYWCLPVLLSVLLSTQMG